MFIAKLIEGQDIGNAVSALQSGCGRAFFTIPIKVEGSQGVIHPFLLLDSPQVQKGSVALDVDFEIVAESHFNGLLFGETNLSVTHQPTDFCRRYNDYSSSLVAEIFRKGDELAQCFGAKDHQTQDTEQCRTNR